jgi:hypothetical protein
MVGWWLLLFGVEVAWLGVLWLALPETRPWGRAQVVAESDPGPEPDPQPEPRVRPWTREAVLAAYMMYHVPVLLAAWLFRLVDLQRVRPSGFVGLGVLSWFLYTMPGMSRFGAGTAIVLPGGLVILSVLLRVLRKTY